jgi:hypothetical protein
MDERTHDDGRARCDAQLHEAVRFLVRGYGATCLACGSLVVGVDGQEIHRRHHRALAALGAPDPP